MNFTTKFFKEAKKSISKIEDNKIEAIAKMLSKLRSNKGRLFIMGVGGSSANASHAVNDFRKLCNIETYCLTDNISELTARTNDDGWDSTFEGYLKNCNLKPKDVLMTFSVGGGNVKKKISMNIVKALKCANKKEINSISFLGKDGGLVKGFSTFEYIVKSNITARIQEAHILLGHIICEIVDKKFI